VPPGHPLELPLAIKDHVPDRIKPSFVFLTSGHSDAQGCTHMATVGAKGRCPWEAMWCRVLYLDCSKEAGWATGDRQTEASHRVQRPLPLRGALISVNTWLVCPHCQCTSPLPRTYCGQH